MQRHKRDRFIADADLLAMKNTINKSNLSVFNEIMIGGTVYGQLCVSERQNSGDGKVIM